MSQDIIGKEGSVINVSFVYVRRQRNTKEYNTDIQKKGAVPLAFAKKQKNGHYTKLLQKDCDARWMSKSGERHYGYKDHINADVKTKFISKYSVSAAAPHDLTKIENIIDATDKKLYEDSAYKRRIELNNMNDVFKRLKEIEEDNLIEIYEDKLVVKESLRMFVRNVYMVFDLRLADAKPE